MLHCDELPWSNYLSIFHVLRETERDAEGGSKGGRQGGRERVTKCAYTFHMHLSAHDSSLGEVHGVVTGV